MAGLFERGAQIDIRSFEIEAVSRVQGELQPVVAALVADARRVLAELVVICETSGHDEARPLRDSYLPFELAVDAAVQRGAGAPGAGSFEAVEEIAAMAGVELRLREERLARCTPAAGLAVVLGACDSAVRCVRKVTSAVDAAIAQAEGVAPRLDFTSEVESSLRVRRAYAKVKKRVLNDGTPSAGELYARFRHVGTTLAVLVGWDVYPCLRVRDRLMLRELQERVLAWLRSGAEASAEDGMRLWQDLTSCLEMLSLVNHRQELMQHDVAVLHQLLERFQRLAAASEVDDATLELAERLTGMDEEFDELLGAKLKPAPAVWSKVVERLCAKLGVPGVGCH
jgi:hypothetical protein